jgi:hypothetical protein
MSEWDLQRIKDDILFIEYQIQLFRKRCKKLSEEQKKTAFQYIKHLEQRKEKLEVELRMMNGATKTAYKDLTTKLNVAWEDLNISYLRAKEALEFMRV